MGGPISMTFSQKAKKQELKEQRQSFGVSVEGTESEILNSKKSVAIEEVDSDDDRFA